MPCAMRGQHLVDAADDGDLLHKGIHLLVARQGQHPSAGLADCVVLVAAEDLQCHREQWNAAHYGGLFARLVDPPASFVVARDVFAPQVVGIGESQPRQAAEDKDVADTGQPVVELLAGQDFQLAGREVLFGLR